MANDLDTALLSAAVAIVSRGNGSTIGISQEGRSQIEVKGRCITLP